MQRRALSERGKKERAKEREEEEEDEERSSAEPQSPVEVFDDGTNTFFWYVNLTT